MNQYDQQQKYLPSRLLDNDDFPENKSVKSDRDSQKMIAFSAPPNLFDIGMRFYQDFLEEITNDDPELDRFGLAKTFNKKTQEKVQHPTNSYRKFSLQTTQEYNSYHMVSVPAPIQNYYHQSSPEDDLVNNLDRVCQWARDQYGSRTVQNAIENGEKYVKQAIFGSLIQESMQLTKDKFGNYVFQKIFEKGMPEHQQKLFQITISHILEYAENCYGCRVVQKAIEYAEKKPQLQQKIINIIEPYSLYLIENLNGNHVMQKCFQIFELDQMKTIIGKILQNLRKLSLHAYGCRVIQKYLQKLYSEKCLQQKQLSQGKDQLTKQSFDKVSEQLQQIKQKEREIFDKLLDISIELSQCQYGNYVMQHIVLHSQEYKEKIENIFYQNFIKLSSNKYASNVIEKVIKLAPAEYREKLAKLLVSSEEFIILAKHQYGNYVIQSLMNKISVQEKMALKNKLRENCQEISKSQYGRHVLMQLDKIK